MLLLLVRRGTTEGVGMGMGGGVSYLHMSLEFLQQGGVLVQPHEGLTEAGGEGQDSWAAGPLALHELVQLLTVDMATSR